MLEEIRKSALRWAENNQDKTCTKGWYNSPRISSEFMDCSTPFSFDLYNFCSFGCLYCFAYYSKANNPSVAHNNKAMELKSVNVDKILDIFEGKFPNNIYYKHFIKNRKVIHIGGLADNFCNFERKNKRGLRIIEYLLKTGYPTIISTKGDFLSIPEYAEMFEKYKDTAKMAIQFSIITNKPELAAQIEVGAPSPVRRMEILKQMHAWGYWTILRLRPFLIGVSDRDLDGFLQCMNTYDIDAISTEFYCLDMRAKEEDKKRYKWMSDVCGFDIIDYYEKLSPASRGTYRRLNRNVKEKYVKKMYKFCVENGKHFAISDPDFKELNMSGSCCGLPDDWNWCRNQMTNLLRLARKKYMETGEAIVTYDDVVMDAIEELWKKENKF
ncbi:MAG: radical SAM protein, partial [Candidatus Paceibacterota bacterium]